MDASITHRRTMRSRCLRFIDVVIRLTPSYCDHTAEHGAGKHEWGRQENAFGCEERMRTGTRCMRRTSKEILRETVQESLVSTIRM